MNDRALNILRRPRQAALSVLDGKAPFWLYFLLGFPAALEFVKQMRLIERWSLLGVVAIGLGVMPLMGWVTSALEGIMLAWVGWMLGGKRRWREMQHVVLWSALPMGLGVVAHVMIALFFGAIVYTPQFDDVRLGGGGVLIVLMAGLLSVIGSVWSFYLLMQLNRTVQEFGWIRSLVSYFAPWIVLVAILVMFAMWRGL